MLRSLMRFGRSCAVILIVFVGATNVLAQRRERSIPNVEYFAALRQLYAGEYRVAMRGFKSASRSGIKTPDLRFVDAVCYETMMGECFYRMGDLQSAKQSYDLALTIFIANKGWLNRLKYPPQVNRKQQRVVNWGPSSRNSVAGGFPDTVLIQYAMINAAALQQNVIVNQKEMYPIHAIEIFRCTALALARRNSLLGPIAPHDQLTSKIERELAKRSAPPGHWAQQIINVPLAIAKIGAGYEDEAVQLLNRSLSVGNMDHQLTSRALIELSKVALKKEQYEVALRSAFEATFSAAQFELFGELEEAFTLASTAHRISSPNEPFSALDAALVWARTQGTERLLTALWIASGERSIIAGNVQKADAAFKTARRAMGRSDLVRGDLGARLNYLMALSEFEKTKTASGNAALGAALKFQTLGSERLYQIAKTFALSKENAISDRVASGLFDKVLRIPSNADWRIDPFDALTVFTTPHLEELEHWLAVAARREEIDTVVELGDRIRRKKFLAKLPLKGRYMAIRWVLNAPEVLLDDDAKLQRQNLLNRFPGYAKLATEINALKETLANMPPIPPESDFPKWKSAAEQLSQKSAQQEAIIAKIALRPQPAQMLFPPIRSMDQIQAGLREGQAILDIIETKTQAYAVVIAAGKDYDQWTIDRPIRIRSSIVNLLKSFGNYDKNKVINAANLSDETWKVSSKKLYQVLFPQKPENYWKGINELIVVPDGAFWYVPFEALIPTERPLISLTKIRYLPMASLTTNDLRRQSPTPSTVIIRGQLYGKADLAAATAKQLTDANANAITHSKFLPVGSAIIGHRWDRLVVLDDIEGIDAEEFDWSPAQADGKGRSAKLRNWMELPFGSPDLVVLAGFHTAAEKAQAIGSGDEIMMNSLAIMSAGTRTLVLSRWRTGGQTSLDIIREFLLQIPESSPVAAWQRSIELTRSAEIDIRKEPRIKTASNRAVPTADHPFFWAGMQLLDMGQPASDN